jgi:hypothetical protein
MKSILTKQNVVKESYPDSYTLSYTSKGLRVNGVLKEEYKESNTKIVNTTAPPTPIFSDVYEWKDSQWVMIENVENLVERIYAKCEQLISKDPQGTPEEWQAYVDKVNAFKDSILQTLGPWTVKITDYEVPSTIYLWELRSIIKSKGLEESVNEAIEDLPEDIKTPALEAWNHGTTIKRYSPTIKLIKTALGLSTYEVDEIFRSATKISI